MLTPRISADSTVAEIDDGIQVHRFRYPSGGRPLGQAGKIPIAAMAVYIISGLTAALKLVIKERPDVIHGNWIVPTGLIAAIAGKLTGIPVINTARGMDTRIGAKGPVKWLFDLTIKLSDRVTVVSEAMHSISGLEQADLTPSGIDEAFFEIMPDPTSQQVVFTRSLVPIYGCETLIRAIPLVIKQIPNARFVIAGDGSQANHLKAVTQELGIEACVKFTGRVSTDEIRKILSESKVFVSPALEDGTSPALMEALAVGLNVVASDISANRTIDMFNHTYFFETKKPADLAEKIILAMAQTNDYEQKITDQTELKARISQRAVARKFIKIYKASTQTNQ